MSRNWTLRVLNTLLLMIILSSAQCLLAQDKIVTRTDKTINCRVTKIGLEYIEYLDGQEEFGKIKKSKVKTIKFSKTPRTPVDYSDNTSKAIKFNLLALRNNAIQLSYEKALDANSSVEITTKIYGVSIRQFENRKIGGGIDIGYRFRLGGLLNKEGNIRNAHVLDGVGIKPVVGASYAQKTGEGAEETYYYLHIGSVLNYQAVFNNRFLFELYGGLHIFKGDSKIQLPNTPLLTGVLDFRDGDLEGEDSIALSVGLKFGYLFGGFDRNAKLLRW